MTPRERAEQAAEAVMVLGASWGWQGQAVGIIERAIADAVADLSALLAQQAARADALQVKLDKHIAYIRTMECELHAEKARADAAEAQIRQRDATCARCDSKGPKAENTIWCASCLEWWREEYRSQHEADEKLDAALAREARLREALERANKALTLSQLLGDAALAGGDHE